MEKGIKKDVIDFYNDMIANKFDCLTIEAEPGEDRIERSIVYYTRSIAVSVDEQTKTETREWVVTPHVLMTSIGHPEIDEEEDIRVVYSTLKKLLKTNGFSTIEYVSPSIIINCMAIQKDEDGNMMVHSNSKKELLQKTFKADKKVKYLPTNIEFKEKDDIQVLFYDGLTLERQHKQPTIIGSLLVDRLPSVSERAKIRDAEFYFRRDEAQKQAEENAKRDRKIRLIKAAHKVLEKERAKKRAAEKELEKIAKKQAKEAVENEQNGSNEELTK